MFADSALYGCLLLAQQAMSTDELRPDNDQSQQRRSELDTPVPHRNKARKVGLTHKINIELPYCSIYSHTHTHTPIEGQVKA